MIDAYASLPHYWTHIRPVWDALPEYARGTLYLGRRVPGARGLSQPPPGPGPLTLVASWTDLDRIRPRRVVLMEHGAGQSYSDRHPAFAGGLERETVDLFLCPGPHSAARNAAAYPGTPVVQIGCPALDRWLCDPPHPSEQLVAVTWHHNPGGAQWPELRWAWPVFRHTLPELARRFPLVGHAHPRARPAIERQYRRLGIRWLDWDDVMERASVLVVDNSSAGFEFAATGRPVVWLDAPGYRQGVDHGLRFYGACPERIADPADLPDAILRATVGMYERATRVHEVYSHLDGRSAYRAAEAILAVLDESEAA